MTETEIRWNTEELRYEFRSRVLTTYGGQPAWIPLIRSQWPDEGPDNDHDEEKETASEEQLS